MIEALFQSTGDVNVMLTTGEVVTAEYAVACDGSRSTTRRLLGLKLLGSSIDTKTSIVADLEIGNLDPESIAANGLEAGVTRMCGERVRKVVWQSRYARQTRMVDRYRIGRVFIAGDAAHIHPPSSAQGLNTGMQDAFNLGWKLVSTIRTRDPTILDTYEAERLPVAAAMFDLTSKLHTTVSKSRGDLTNRLGLSCAGGPLATGPAHGSLNAGDRIPDQRLADGRRLYEAMCHVHGIE